MSTTITGCIRQSDGKLIFADTSCEVELPACLGASGQLLVYHEDCDGVGESDGWFEVCIGSGGVLQIEVPDNCCGVVTATYNWVAGAVHPISLSAFDFCDTTEYSDNGYDVDRRSSVLRQTGENEWTLWGFCRYDPSVFLAFRGTNDTLLGTYSGIDYDGNPDTAIVSEEGTAGSESLAVEGTPPISCDGDVAVDGVINILDVIYVAIRLCSADASADANTDEHINAEDIWYVIDRLGGSC